MIKALNFDVNMKESFQTCLQTIFQAYMQTNILTYRQPRKKILKKKKIVFKHTNLQTSKQLLCKRDRSAVKYIMPEQDSLKTIIHVIKHLSLHALEITSKFAFMFSNILSNNTLIYTH